MSGERLHDHWSSGLTCTYLLPYSLKHRLMVLKVAGVQNQHRENRQL